MDRDQTIGTGSFTLRRDEVLNAMLDQRDASAEIVEKKTGFWRKLRLLAVVIGLPIVVVGIVLDRQPYMTIGFVALFVCGGIYQISDWWIKRTMKKMGVTRRVSRKSVIKAFDKRIFKGRDSVRGEARFGEDGFELVQDEVRFSAAYDDSEKIDVIFERNGWLQIVLGPSRKLPDVVFLIPLSKLSDPDAVMERVRMSPMFVFDNS